MVAYHEMVLYSPWKLSAHLCGNSKGRQTGSMPAVDCRLVDNHVVDNCCYGSEDDDHDTAYSCNNPLWRLILLHFGTV